MIMWGNMHLCIKTFFFVLLSLMAVSVNAETITKKQALSFIDGLEQIVENRDIRAMQ